MLTNPDIKYINDYIENLKKISNNSVSQSEKIFNDMVKGITNESIKMLNSKIEFNYIVKVHTIRSSDGYKLWTNNWNFINKDKIDEVLYYKINSSNPLDSIFNLIDSESIDLCEITIDLAFELSDIENIGGDEHTRKAFYKLYHCEITPSNKNIKIDYNLLGQDHEEILPKNWKCNLSPCIEKISNLELYKIQFDNVVKADKPIEAINKQTSENVNFIGLNHLITPYLSFNNKVSLYLSPTDMINRFDYQGSIGFKISRNDKMIYHIAQDSDFRDSFDKKENSTDKEQTYTIKNEPLSFNDEEIKVINDLIKKRDSDVVIRPDSKIYIKFEITSKNKKLIKDVLTIIIADRVIAIFKDEETGKLIEQKASIMLFVNRKYDLSEKLIKKESVVIEKAKMIDYTTIARDIEIASGNIKLIEKEEIKNKIFENLVFFEPIDVNPTSNLSNKAIRMHVFYNLPPQSNSFLPIETFSQYNGYYCWEHNHKLETIEEVINHFKLPHFQDHDNIRLLYQLGEIYYNEVILNNEKKIQPTTTKFNLEMLELMAKPLIIMKKFKFYHKRIMIENDQYEGRPSIRVHSLLDKSIIPQFSQNLYWTKDTVIGSDGNLEHTWNTTIETENYKLVTVWDRDDTDKIKESIAEYYKQSQKEIVNIENISLETQSTPIPHLVISLYDKEMNFIISIVIIDYMIINREGGESTYQNVYLISKTIDFAKLNTKSSIEIKEEKKIVINKEILNQISSKLLLKGNELEDKIKKEIDNYKINKEFNEVNLNEIIELYKENCILFELKYSYYTIWNEIDEDEKTKYRLEYQSHNQDLDQKLIPIIEKLIINQNKNPKYNFEFNDDNILFRILVNFKRFMYSKGEYIEGKFWEKLSESNRRSWLLITSGFYKISENDAKLPWTNLHHIVTEQLPRSFNIWIRNQFEKENNKETKYFRIWFAKQDTINKEFETTILWKIINIYSFDRISMDDFQEFNDKYGKHEIYILVRFNYIKRGDISKGDSILNLLEKLYSIIINEFSIFSLKDNRDYNDDYDWLITIKRSSLYLD